MLRVVAYLVVALILITLLRSVIGVITKALAGALGSGPGGRAGGTQMGGELKRDPVCGTYVSTATSIKVTSGGQVIHFCSAACRDKFQKS